MNVTLPVNTKAPDVATEIPEGSQDWQLLVTEGHVRGHRVVSLLRTFTVPALLSGLIGGFLAFQSLTGGLAGYGFPQSLGRPLAQALTYNPATFVSAPAVSDQDLDYRLAWLANLSPVRGLDEAGWAALVKAAAADIATHGDKTADYTAVPALASAPVVTRPAKVFADHSADLASGVIAIPLAVPPGQTAPPAHVVAWVGGKLAWAVIAPGPRIGIIFGPVPQGAGQVPSAPPELINQLKPGA